MKDVEQGEYPSIKHSVLVVEDCVELAELICVYMRKNGFNCMIMTSVENALDYFHHGYRPDIIITDMHLEALSGIDLLGKVRSDSAMAATPVVLISSAVDVIEIAADCGFDEILLKKSDFHTSLPIVVKSLLESRLQPLR